MVSRKRWQQCLRAVFPLCTICSNTQLKTLAQLKGQITEETIPMKLTWHGNKGWGDYLAGKNSTQEVTDEGDRSDG